MLTQSLDHFKHPTQLKLEHNIKHLGAGVQQRNRWSPYEVNEGTVAAVRSDQCLVFAADTRVSRGYSILSRNFSKIHELSDTCYLLSSGMIADIQGLREKLDENIREYEIKMDRKPSLKSMAKLLSRTLYGKRFFPFYTFNVLVGLHDDGTPAVYSYDAIGSYENSMCSVNGSGKDLMSSMLDNQFMPVHHIEKDVPTDPKRMQEIMIDAFQSAAERDLYTGDSLEVIVLQKGQLPQKSKYSLRRDQSVCSAKNNLSTYPLNHYCSFLGSYLSALVLSYLKN